MITTVFSCNHAWLVGNVHAASRTVGVVIVTGGGQVRAGPQRLFLRLATNLSGHGFPVMRFDRRGIGDSDGADEGFENCGPDIAAAAAELRRAQPQVRQVVGIGLCDGATAMLLAPHELDGMVLLNPWVIEDGAALTAVAVEAHYRRRLLQPAAWLRLFSGNVDIGMALRSLLGRKRSHAMGNLEMRVASAIDRTEKPLHLILSSRDRTADAFRPLAESRRGKFATSKLIPADHAFSSADAEAALFAEIGNILTAW